MRVGIVGTNFISDWFVEAARRVPDQVEPWAVYSRSLQTGTAFAEKNEIPEVTDDYGALLDLVDAVYIASPTGIHFSQARDALKKGKHVLVEKTMTSNVEQAQELFDLAQQRDLVLMEATRNLHAPAHALVGEALSLIGPIRYAALTNLQYSSRYGRHLAGEDVNAFNPELGNSAMADIGVYCLEPALDWFGVPLSHTGTSVRLQNGFEALGSLQLDYESHLVDLAYSKVVDGATDSQIVGEGGAITIDNIAQPSKITLIKRGESPQVLLEDTDVTPTSNMHFEIMEFSKQVEAGHTDDRWRAVSLEARRIMDEHLARS